MTERRGLDVLAVDDEAPARDELAFLLDQQPAVGRVSQAADGARCLELLAAHDYDAVFLDVRMPNLDGVALAQVIGRLAKAPPVVFVTAFDDRAVEAFGLDAVDYLLKPVRPERLSVTIGRLLRTTRAVAGEGDAPVGDRIGVQAPGGKILVVPVNEIRLAGVDHEHTFVLTPAGRYGVRSTLSELEQRLKRHPFLRVHRRHLVNLNHVASVEGSFNGTYLLRLSGLPNLAVPVSRRHAPDLKAALGL